MADRRVLILQAAERLLGHYGLQKTTVADIAREAKIGVGTVYLEFNSKDAIISELSDAKYRHVLRAMRRAARAAILRAPTDASEMPFTCFSALGSALNTPASVPKRASNSLACGLVSPRALAPNSRYSSTS